MAIGTYISIITLNVNGLNAPTKWHGLAEWIQKQDPYVCCLQETHFRPQDTYRLKVRGYKNIFHANGKQKKAGVAILISDKIDLKIKITRDKEGWSEIAQSCPTLCDPMDCSPPGSSVHGILPGKNTGVGCHFLLQGIFPTQGSNPSLPHCRQML